MTSRRTLLFGAAGTLLAARLSSGCDGDIEATTATSQPTSAPTTTRATASPTTTSPTTMSPEPSTPPPVRNAWDRADFSDLDSFVERTNGEAFAIWEDGEMIHEWYRTDASYTRDVASAQKSVVSVLVGRAIGDGLVQMDTPIDDVLGGNWTPDGQSTGISIEHLLAMTSGLDDQLAVVAVPGERWLYSGAFAALFDVLTTVTGRDVNELANDWLFDPVGAPNSVFYERPAGLFAPIGLRSTVPDLIAIGSGILDGAVPGLDDGWFDRSFTPSQSLNRSYGMLWWLNGQESFMLPGPDVQFPGALVPTAPASMVAALGKDDQKLYIVAENRMVVARLGGRAVTASQAARSPFDIDLWERISELRN